jgi:hypothetical protein
VDAAEILKQAWASVEASGVPEHLQETALREAVAILRDQGGAAPAATVAGQAAASGVGNSRPGKAGGRRAASRRAPAKSPDEANVSSEVPSEEEFFRNLADASGVDEAKLRDILQMKADGTVALTPPTRILGNSIAVQARNVVALIAPARLHGMGEKPVSANAVRAECARKDCFDPKNFGPKVIGKLGGVNYGATNAEMVLTAKWVKEFQAAASIANGESAEARE